MYKKKRKRDDISKECNVLESIEHFILKCQSYDMARHQLTRELMTFNKDAQLYLLSPPDTHDRVYTVFKYIYKTGKYSDL